MTTSGGTGDSTDGSKNAPGLRQFSVRTLAAVALASILVTASVMYVIMRTGGTPTAELDVHATETQTVFVTVPPRPTAEMGEPTSETVITTTATQVAAVPPATPSESRPTPAESPGWVNLEENLTTPEEAHALRDAPDGFPEFLADFVGQEDDWGCLNEVTVWAMHPDGFAYGGMWAEGCGGAQYIWGDIYGWGEVLLTQDMFECSELETAGVPEDVGSGLDCYDGNDVYYY